jgi:hypothetical protein
MARYTTDEVMAMMQSPQPEVEVLERPASPFLDPAQINAAERELSQPAPEVPRPNSINAPGANLLLQNYTAEEAFPVDSTPAPQRPADGNAALYPSRNETSPNLPKPRYSTDEVISLYANESKPRLSTKQVMVEMIKPLYDPTLPRPSKEEFFKLRDIEKQLRDSGDIPSNFEETANAVGGFFVTAVDALNTALWKVDREQGLFEFGGMGVNPALAVSETWRRLPGTIAYGAEMTKQGYAAMGAGLQAMGGPKYRVKETGEFVMDEEGSAGGQFGQIDPRTAVERYKANGLTLAPVNAEDLRDFEYQQWGQGMDRSMEVEKARTAAYPEETVYKILSNAPAGVSDTVFGTDYLRALENRPAPPMESQAVGASILADPATYISLGAGAAKIGLSAAMKGATARSLNVIGKATQRFVNPAEVPLRAMDRFRKVVVSPAKVAGAYGAASGVAWAADQFELPSELKTAAFTAASLYTAYKGGLGVLRFAGKNLPEAAVILRESADATSGLDRAARQAVAANPNVPANISERLLRPSQFVSMESTPARLAQNQQLSPGTRKLMDKLSNFYVVQGVRGASAVATGSVKGGLAMVPFAETMRMSGDDRAADTMYGMGLALGALGGAGERVLGARGRRVAQAESDIGRMLTDIQAGNVQPGVKRYQWIDREVGRLLTDVELAAGDVNALVQNRSFDELARTAAMQGFFRNVDYIPLNAADFELNAKEHGGSGSAGYFIRANAGERPQIFVNVEARRADVEPHEYFEAFFSSDAFSPEQRAAMRAQVDQRYGADGLMARGREYAEALIKAENSKNFPNETLFVSNEQIQLKMDELAQDELGRGGQDPMDWVRREVMVEEARMAGIDFAAIRRNVPAGENPITFMENVLGASARALGLSGVRIAPETGMAITPEQLFRENPVAANDPKLVKHLNDYVKAYRQWMNDPTHEVPQGVRIARDGRPESLADNPNVSFYSPKPEDPTVPRENALAIIGPDGRVIEKSPKQRRTERKARSSQVKNMAGRNLLAPGDPTFGLKRWADGRIRASGRRLPQTMALQVHWKPWLPIINAMEGLADSGESMQVRYFAKGNSADKVKTSRVSDIDAINREVVFDQWTTNAAGDLLAQLLDMTTLRNRAMRAISERHPSLDPANGGPGYSLQAIMDDVTQWMSDKRAGKDGAATIGNDRKNIVNALINPGTAVNRGKNPLAGTFGKGSAIKTLLLENINAVSGTGRKGAAMDYNWANGNFMPDKPAPRPDMDSDVQAPRGMRMPQQIPREAQGMPDAVETLTTDQLLRQYEENQGYLGLSTLGMREGRPVRGGAAQTRELLRRNEAISAELERRGVRSEDAQLQRALQRRGQAMPDAGPILSAGDADTLPVVQKLNDKGKPAMKDGKPEAASIGYDLLRAPGIVDYVGNKAEDLTKPNYDGLDYDVGPQLRKEIDAAIDSGAVDSAANRTAEFAREQMQNPEIAAGKGWYSRMREKLLSAVGEQGRELLSQLLGATSAKTPVDQNFLQAMDAYEGILAGRYEKHRQGYLEMKALESEGKLVPTILERGYVDVLRERANKLSRGAARLPRKADRTAAKSEANALRKLVNKAPEKWDPSEARAIMIEATGILPMRSNGKKFNANSRAVLKVIADDWKINRQAPKTPNFAGNLSGRTVQATIDVWAARHLRELLYKGSGKPWRIQPKSEVGVTNHDFALGQIIMQRAAKKLDMNPDDLQAILWFAEKHKWDAKGWTDNAGAEKSSFDTVANLFFPEGKKPLSFDEASKMYNDMKAAEKAAKKAQDKAVKAAAAKL